LRLHRYLASLTLVRAAGALVLVCGVYASIDLVEAGSLASVPGGELLTAYPLKLPGIAAQMLPLALLFGVLLALSRLRRGGEWDALRSAGLSPLRASVGLIAVPVLGALLALPLVEWLGPIGLARFQDAAGITSAGDNAQPQWTRTAGGALRRSAGSREPAISIERDAEGRVLAYRRGDAAWRRGAGWGAAEPQRSGPPGVSGETASMPAAGALAGAELTRPALERAIDALEVTGRDASALLAQGALRVALVAGCLLAPLLGLLIALRSEEDRASRLIALGLAVGAAYWLAVAVAWNGAVLGAWSARWVSIGAPILFLAVVSVLTVTVLRAGSRAAIRPR